jgi:hypothetical protein
MVRFSIVMKRAGNVFSLEYTFADASFNQVSAKFQQAAFSMRSVFSAAAVIMTCGKVGSGEFARPGLLLQSPGSRQLCKARAERHRLDYEGKSSSSPN